MDAGGADASEAVSIDAAIHMAEQIDAARRLVDLSGDELLWLCDWDAAMRPSLETFVDCDSGPIRISTVYPCRKYHVVPTCQATVADVRACTRASVRDPCTSHEECHVTVGCIE
jgi:hypothetical protein